MWRMWALVLVLLVAVLVGGCATATKSTGALSMKITAAAPWLQEERAGKPILQAYARGNKVIRIDGDLSDWKLEKMEGASVKEAKSSKGAWSGPEDLSIEGVYVMIDDEKLYLAFKVKDDVYYQDKTDGNIWQADSVQVAFDPLLNPYDLQRKEDDYEFGFALTENGPICWRWIAARGKPTGLVKDVELAIKQVEGGLVYEIAIPVTEIAPLNPFLYEACGFTFLANDSDGEGRESYAEWTGGIAECKDPTLFGVLRFPKIKPTVASGIVQLKNIFADDDESYELRVGIASAEPGQARLFAKFIKEGEEVKTVEGTVKLDEGRNWFDITIPVKALPPGRYTLTVDLLRDGKVIGHDQFRVYRYSTKQFIRKR